MISAPQRRDRRAALLWCLPLSAAIQIALLVAIFHNFQKLGGDTGPREQIVQRITTSIQKQAPTPPPATPRPQQTPATVTHHSAAPPASHAAPIHELAKAAPTAPPQPPKLSTPSPLDRDNAAFARQVAQLKAGNDPHAIPTIDPSQQQSASKSYGMEMSGSSSDNEHGNGVITPTRDFKQNGMDCYYGRYTYTYPDGAEEEGAIAWPFCYDPASDPFHQPPHHIAFPLPLPGYVLPPGTELPPLEKEIYEHWASTGGG